MKNLNKILLVVAILIVGVAIALTLKNDDPTEKDKDIVKVVQPPEDPGTKRVTGRSATTVTQTNDYPTTSSPVVVTPKPPTPPKVTPTPTPTPKPLGPLRTEDELRELEDAACPTCGSCAGLFTANSMNCLTEAIGMGLPGNGTQFPAGNGLFGDPLSDDIIRKF